MERDFIDPSLKRHVFEKYNNRCHACGSTIKFLRRLHHVIPVALGGTDKIKNLRLLCANCHTLVHAFSARRSGGKDISSLLTTEYKPKAIKRIARLSKKIRQAKEGIRQGGNRWSARNPNSQRPYTIKEAISSVAHRNKYNDIKRKQLEKAFLLTLRHIPRTLKARCSYRLLRGGRYISVLMMNYLLYRSPAYGDLGRKPTYDCYLIFTNGVRNRFKAFDEKNVFTFAHFDCVMLGLSFEEVLALSAAKWKDFSTACRMAAQARKSSNRVSNIRIQ